MSSTLTPTPELQELKTYRKLITKLKAELAPLLIRQKDLQETKQVMYHVHNNHLEWNKQYSNEYAAVSGKICGLNFSLNYILDSL